MKLNKKVLNGSLVVLLALGLGGCAANNATSTHKTNEASSSQVVKQNNHKKADKTSVKTDVKYAAQKNETSVNSSSVNTTSASVVSNHTNKAATTNTASSNAPATQATTNSTSTSAVATAKQTQNIQLGLGDVATWTDAKGVTHHVDSDGMDRYTTKGNNQVQYQDWSGQLPSNAVVSHH